MAAVSIATLPPYAPRKSTVSSLSPFTVTSSLPFHGTTFSLQIRALAQRTESEGGIIGSQANLLRKPSILSRKELGEISEDEISRDFNQVEEGRIDWERQILQETAPLVNFVRTILHSDKYANGDRLDPDHEKLILDKLLPFHPEFEDKIGCGVNYLTVYGTFRNLKDLSLEGTLASEIGNLIHMKSIILRNNSFGGIIPENVGAMKELEVLDLGYNNFTGPLPLDLGSNLSLIILLLDNNERLGSYSSEINEIQKLSETQVDEHQLSCVAKSSSKIIIAR